MAEQTENPRVQSAGGVASGAACMVSRADRILAPNVPTSVIVVGARIARPRREAAFHERCDSCEKPVHTTAPQRPPCAKGPQGSAACGRTSDRSDWAAACLDGPQCGPSRLSGNPGAWRSAGGDQRLRDRRTTIPQSRFASQLPLHKGACPLRRRGRHRSTGASDPAVRHGRA